MTRIGSLCSGYEGLGMAVQSVLGGELAWVADNDEGASAVLAHRYPSLKNLGDITLADWGEVEPVDVLTAGFPCQDVSAAGKRAGLRKGTRSGVWIEVAHAIAVLRPGLVVIENVRGLLTARGDEPTDEHLRAEAARDAAMHLEQWLDNKLNIALSKGDADRVRQCRVRAARVMGVRKRAVARCLWHERRLVRAIGTVLGSLADLGFDAEWACTGADDAGSCHQRKRVFILAWPAVNAESIGRGLGGGREWQGGQGEQRGLGAAERGPRAPADAERDGQPGWSASATGEADEQGQGSRAEAAGRGTGPAADAECDGLQGGGPASGTDEGRQAAPSIGRRPALGGLTAADPDDYAARAGREPGDTGRCRAEPAQCRDTAADATGNGRDERRSEPAGVVGGPDAAERGDGPAAYAPRVGHGDAGQEGQRGIPAAAVTGAPADPEDLGQPELAGGTDRGELAEAWPDAEGISQRPRPGAGDRSGTGNSAERAIDWGNYEPAIRRWEDATGRAAPPPTEPGRNGQRLNPRFVEWMMGLPEGWVTDVPGLTRNAQLKALGNGVVPQQAAMALRMLLPACALGVPEPSPVPDGQGSLSDDMEAM